MHSGIIVARSDVATALLFESAYKIASALDMEEELSKLESFSDQPGANRDKNMLEMYRIEAVAEFMSSLADRVGEFFETSDELFDKICSTLNESQIASLAEQGYVSSESLNAATDEMLLSVKGIGPSTLSVIRHVIAQNEVP